MVAFFAVLMLGILKGVLLAAIASILMLLRRTAAPYVAFLGRIPGTRSFSDLAHHPENERLAGVLAFRVESALLYFNVEHVRETVLDGVGREGAGLRLVVCDLSSSPYVDLAGARMLQSLNSELASRGIGFRLAEARAAVRELLRAAGLEKTIGPIEHGTTVADAVARAGT
jgi:MFS superfamily sulfate permease-like transporter